MKKLLPATLFILTTLLTSCLKAVIGPDGQIITGNTTTTAGGSVSTSSPDSYLPLAKGNTWNYDLSILGVSQPVSFVVTGNTTTINGKLYYETNAVIAGASSPGYFSHNGSIYTERNITSDPQAVDDEPFLDDSQAAGSSYTLPGNDAGTLGGLPFRYVVTIKEKNITYTVNSKTYQNVIHTHSESQLNSGSGFYVSDSHEYYFAKGIGIIEMDETQGSTILSKQTITSYTLK